MHPGVLGLLLIVRIYDNAGLTAADAGAAQQTAADVFRAAGITTAWIFCTAPGRPTRPDPAACAEPPGPSTVIVRVARRPLVHGTGDVLGGACVDTAARAGTLATVYVDRVAAFAARAPIEISTVIGWTMAHELGHLLLGTAAHSGQGLMRAEWSTAMVTHPSDLAWRFSRREAAVLVENLIARSRQPDARPVTLAAAKPVGGADRPSASIR